MVGGRLSFITRQAPVSSCRRRGPIEGGGSGVARSGSHLPGTKRRHVTPAVACRLMLFGGAGGQCSPCSDPSIGPSCVSPRRSSNANSLCGQNSAGSRESARPFKGIFCDDVSEFESYMPSHAVGLSASLGGWRVSPRHAGSMVKGEKPGDSSPADREIRASRQSQDRESARPRNTANIARCRGRSD
jgi:hypothetical protein